MAENGLSNFVRISLAVPSKLLKLFLLSRWSELFLHLKCSIGMQIRHLVFSCNAGIATENKVSRCAREDVSNVRIMLLAYIIKIILTTYL